MTTLADRLKSALEHRQKIGRAQGVRLTRADLARHCRVTQQAVSEWFRGGTVSLAGESLVRASQFLGVNPGWLASGRGPMAPTGLEVLSVPPEELSDEERALLIAYRSLPPGQQTQVLGLVKSMRPRVARATRKPE